MSITKLALIALLVCGTLLIAQEPDKSAVDQEAGQARIQSQSKTATVIEKALKALKTLAKLRISAQKITFW